MAVKDDIVKKIRLVYLFLAILAAAIVVKMLYLQFIQGDYWEAKAAQLTQKDIIIQPNRGDICAIDGKLLATSVPLYEIRMDLVPQGLPDEVFFENVDTLAHCLSELFQDKTKAEYATKLREAHYKKERYLLIQRQVSYGELEQLKTFPIFNRGQYKGGFIYEQLNKRIQPHVNLASRTIGYTTESQEGNKVGLEGAYDKDLAGRVGVQPMQKLAGNHWMEIDAENVIEPMDGNDIMTTIDVTIQDVAENALMRQLKKYEANHGTAILMEVQTGEIRAIANLTRAKDNEYYEMYNYAVGETTEPGSTFKLAPMIVALEDGVIDIFDTIDTGNGVKKYYSFIVRDAKLGGHGKITVEEVLELSSNVGISTIIYDHYSRNPEKFVERLYNMRLNERLRLDIQGEGRPYIKYPGDPHWSQISIAQMAIGYEVKLTPLQMLTFYNAIANDGKMVKPRFVRSINQHGVAIRSFDTEVLHPSVCSNQTIRKVKKMLEGVVERGTAKNLRTDNYKIAGKTGTAKIFDQKTKQYVEKYKASFVGYFPADAPKYSCYVMISDPKYLGYYGSIVAGPVFREIADKVYATSYELHDEMELKENHIIVEVPYSKNGSKADTEQVFNLLGIPIEYYNDLSSPWIVTKSKEKSVEFDNRFIQKGLVPNVMGMGAKDAVYILENAGLKVVFSGRGSVSEQSIMPGKRVERGKVIRLKLGA